MATITGNYVNPSINGSSGDVEYDAKDVQDVLAQQDAVSITSTNVILTITLGGVSPIPVTALVAVDGNGQKMEGDDNLFALPCPVYC